LLGTVRARNLFLKILEQVRRGCVASIVGYVVMPEHVHLLLSEPKKRDTGEIVASVEAARVARHARTQETQGQRATVTGLSRIARRTAAILATQILRLQRL